MDNYNKADMWVEIDRIKEDPNNPRKIFSIEHIEGLAQSIKQEGLINPIECDSEFVIITGHCRFRAAQLLNWKKVPVRINPEIYGEYERLRHQMSENVHQSGTSQDSLINPEDTAKGYARLISLKVGRDYKPGLLSKGDTYGLIKPLAEEIGITPETIYEHLRLLEEPEFIRKAIREGMPRTYIRTAALAPLEAQEGLKKKIAAGDYNSREEIMQDVQILRRLPDLGQLELERRKSKENQSINRILNGIARLGLALEAQPLEGTNGTDKNIIKAQLVWIQERIERYLN